MQTTNGKKLELFMIIYIMIQSPIPGEYIIDKEAKIYRKKVNTSLQQLKNCIHVELANNSTINQFIKLKHHPSYPLIRKINFPHFISTVTIISYNKTAANKYFGQNYFINDVQKNILFKRLISMYSEWIKLHN